MAASPAVTGLSVSPVATPTDVPSLIKSFVVFLTNFGNMVQTVKSLINVVQAQQQMLASLPAFPIQNVGGFRFFGYVTTPPSGVPPNGLAWMYIFDGNFTVVSTVGQTTTTFTGPMG